MRASVCVQACTGGLQTDYLCAWEGSGGCVEYGAYEHKSSSKAAASLSQDKL